MAVVSTERMHQRTHLLCMVPPVAAPWMFIWA